MPTSPLTTFVREFLASPEVKEARKAERLALSRARHAAWLRRRRAARGARGDAHRAQQQAHLDAALAQGEQRLLERYSVKGTWEAHEVERYLQPLRSSLDPRILDLYSPEDA